jgi:hypothetical protein
MIGPLEDAGFLSHRGRFLRIWQEARTVCRISTRQPNGHRMRFDLEALEVRLPVSESISIAIAVATLSSISAAFGRSEVQRSAPPFERASWRGREHSSGRTGSEGSVRREKTAGHPRALEVKIGQVAPHAIREPFNDLTGDSFASLGNTARARHEHARHESGSNTPAGGLATQPRAVSRVTTGTHVATALAAQGAAGPSATPGGGVVVVAATRPAATVQTTATQPASPAPTAATQPAATAQTTSSNLPAQHLAPVRAVQQATTTVTLGQQSGAPDTTQFHGDAARTGFNQNETFLTPTNVGSSFGQVWQSPLLDGHLYASPLYQDNITIQGDGNAANHAGDGVQSASFQGQTLGAVLAATGGGTVYAIAAQDTNGPTGIAPGTILWETHLGNPYGGTDGNSIGVLSTPIIDIKSNRIYVTASVTDYLLPPATPITGGTTGKCSLSI